jgi:hypothetical protein
MLLLNVNRSLLCFQRRINGLMLYWYRNYVVFPLRDSHCWLSSLLRNNWVNRLVILNFTYIYKIWKSIIVNLLILGGNNSLQLADVRALVYHWISVAKDLLGGWVSILYRRFFNTTIVDMIAHCVFQLDEIST